MHQLIDHLLRICLMPDYIQLRGAIRKNEIFSIITGCLEKEETDIYTIILRFYLYTGVSWVILCFLWPGSPPSVSGYGREEVKGKVK